MTLNLRIKALRAHLKLAVARSRTLHGKWAVAHKTGNMPLRTKRFRAWKKQVDWCKTLTARLQALEAAANAGVTTSSQAVADSISVFEGGQSSDGLFHPYQDSVGVWTIGYGHTNADGAPSVSAGTHPLTHAEAETLLHHDLNTYYTPAVAAAFKEYGIKPTQKEFDALTSFAYNLGPGDFTPAHDVGKALEAHNPQTVAKAILEYDEAGGQVLAGLLRRRRWEAQLYLGGTYSVT